MDSAPAAATPADSNTPPEKVDSIVPSENAMVDALDGAARWRDLFAAAMELPVTEVTAELAEKKFLALYAAQKKSSQEKQEQKKRESALLMRLSIKEQEIRDLQTELQELRSSLQPRALQMKVTLLDPAVNAEFKRLRAEIRRLEDELKQAHAELEAAKFTIDSNNGKQLIEKIRKLQKENDTFGKEYSEGKTQELELLLGESRTHLKFCKDELAGMNNLVTSLLDQEDTLHLTIQEKDNTIQMLRREIERQQSGGATGGASE